MMRLERSSEFHIGLALADAARVVAAASVVGSAFVNLPGGPIVFAILVGVLLAARGARIAWPFDLAMGCWLLLAMWGAVAGLGMGAVGSLLFGIALLAWGVSGRSGHRPRTPEPQPEPSA